MVSEYVEINSKSYIKKINRVRSVMGILSSKLNHHKKERGTDIILHINDDSKEFLEEGK